MPDERFRPPNVDRGVKRPSWLIVIIVVSCLGYAWWQNNRAVQEQPNVRNPDARTVDAPNARGAATSVSDADEPQTAENFPERHPVVEHKSFRIENQTIRDLNGDVVFKGTIDLGPTLDRIERGDHNRHRNDGTTFQNREGSLPRKPAGYYKEYVHPTPGGHGPGPQRVILGKDCEIWYTGDHYKTFHEIKAAKHATDRE